MSNDDKFYGGLRVGAAGAPGGIAIPPGSGTQRDVYLSPTGNDSANGSISAPWLTLARVQAEFDKCSYGSLSLVRLYMAAGTYTACNFDGSAFAVGGRFVIQALSTSLLLSGTIVAGSTISVLNTSALGATDFTRKWMRRRSQSGVVLDERQIQRNTSTTITPSVSFLSVPATTDTFEIYEPSVIVNGSAGLITISNFPGMGGYINRFLLGGLTDPGGGGVYMADIRWSWTTSPTLQLVNTFLFTKVIQFVQSSGAAVDARIFMDLRSSWGSGINYLGNVLVPQFLSTFMFVADDNIWLGCGIGGDSGFRIEGGNFFGYIGAWYLLTSASFHDTIDPIANICGGSLDVPVGVASNALVASFGTTVVRNPALAPYNPMPITCPVNFSTAVHTAPSQGQYLGGLYLSYANVQQNQASGAVPAVRSDGGNVTISSTTIGNSVAGFGIETRNGGTIRLLGALNITGGSGDSRVDGANIQPKAFYSAAQIANPATPLGDGSKIYRFS